MIPEKSRRVYKRKKIKTEHLKDYGIINLYRMIISYIYISDTEWQYCQSMLSSSFFLKKSMLLNENDDCDKIFFVVSGLLRIYFADEKGEEKTFHFCLENTFATDYESFLKNVPSNHSIQAMEDTVVIVISREMLHNFYNTVRYGEKLGRLITQEYFFIINDKIKALYTNSPKERYVSMNRHFPNLFQRVPQYYIASYLNITPVHLSRLKYTLRKDA